jgi:hypothetical protein
MKTQRANVNPLRPSEVLHSSFVILSRSNDLSLSAVSGVTLA